MKLKEKIRKKQVTIGSWITIGSPAVAEIMAKSAVDWLAVDMEHSALSMDQCQELIRVINLCGVPPFVRVGKNDPLLISRSLDAGAQGIIVPMVNSAQDAKKAVQAVKYPPEGSRGVGLARAQGYGPGFDQYIKKFNEESIVIVQIEHKDALGNLMDIFSVEGVDGFIVGPYDLSASLGVPGQFTCVAMNQALADIMKAADEHNISAGYHVVHPKAEDVHQKIGQGYQFIAFGVDFLFLGEHYRDGLSQIRQGQIEQLNRIQEAKV